MKHLNYAQPTHKRLWSIQPVVVMSQAKNGLMFSTRDNNQWSIGGFIKGDSYS